MWKPVVDQLCSQIQCVAETAAVLGFSVLLRSLSHTKSTNDFVQALRPVASIEPPTPPPFSYVREYDPLFDALLSPQALKTIHSLQKEVSCSCQETSIDCKRRLQDLDAMIASKDVKAVVRHAMRDDN